MRLMMIEFELSPWMCFSMAKYCVCLKSLQESMAAAVFFWAQDCHSSCWLHGL